MNAAGRPAPTRQNLLALERRLEHVGKGTGLLRRKREALVAELFRLARPAVSARLLWEYSKDNKEGEKSQTFELPLAGDKSSAEISLPLKASGA